MYISLPFFFQCFVLFKKCCERETPSNYFVKLYFYRSYSNAADGAMEKNNAISNRKNEVFIRGKLRVHRTSSVAQLGDPQYFWIFILKQQDIESSNTFM